MAQSPSCRAGGALGARREQVILLIVCPSIALAGAGAACGVILAIVQSRLLKTLLYGVSPVNPVVLVLASGVLVAVAALAAYLPACKASTADPATVLRQD